MARKDDAIAPLLPIFIIGVMLNTLGIVFTSLGWARYVMMVAGLALMLVFLVRVLRARANPPDGPAP